MTCFIRLLAAAFVSQTLVIAAITTTTSLTATPNPVTLSQVVTLTATVTPASQAGAVEFLDGGVPVGAATLSGGVASFRIANLTSGRHALRARYIASPTYASSVSAAVSLNVNAVAAGGFLPPSTISQPNGRVLFSADFNNDGLLDLVWADENFNLYIQLGQGGGNYGPPSLVGTNISPTQTFAADFNGDGHLDIGALDGYLTVIPGRGDGTFQSPITTRPPTDDFFIGAFGDFNNDGIPDFVGTANEQTSIYLGNGDGTFRDSSSIAGDTDFLVTGDFDGDGNTDIALFGQVAGVYGLYLFYGNGSAGFAIVTVATTSLGGEGLAAGDLNGDGIVDLVTFSNGQGPSSSLQVLLGSKSRTLSPAAPVECDNGPALAVADFNGDGKLDVMVGGSTGFSSMYPGNGDGTLQPEIPVFLSQDYYQFSGSPQFLDWDGDGRLDIYLAGVSGTGNIFLGAPATTTSLTVSPLIGISGQPLTTSASVSPASATGSVSFFDNSQPFFSTYALNTTATLSGGVASTELPNTNLGANYVFAVYTGDSTHAASVSAMVLSNLDESTSVTISSNLSSQIVGQPVTFTATVAVSPIAAIAGSVTFYDGVDVVGSGPISQAQAEVSVEFGTAGTHTIVARYDGPPGFLTSTSSPLPVLITEAAGGTLQPGESLPTGATPTAIALQDVNNDGYLDLLSGSSSSSKLEVFLGHGTADFLTPLLATTSLPGLQAMAIGDFDLNGKPDVVVASASTPAIQVLSGKGDGTFAALPVLTTTANPSSLAVADFNGDGAPDLVIGYGSGSDISVALNTPGTGFTQLSNVAAGASPTALAVGDFNGDGLADIAVTNTGANTVSILLGNGDGTFLAPAPFATDVRPIAIVAGDLNADGKTDLVVANAGSSDLSVLLGNGDGTFAAETKISVGASPTAVALGDFNGDGQIDIAVVAGSNMLVLYGSSGSFGTPITIGPTGAGGSALAVAGLDGQGHINAVTSAAAGMDAEIFLDDAPTTTALTVASSTGIFGIPVALSATVTPATYVGSVSFFDGANLLGSARVAGGKAEFRTNVLQPGIHSLTAQTVLTAGYLASKSNAVATNIADLPSASLGIPRVVNPNGTSVYKTIAADVNNDGKLDILYDDNQSQSICVEFGNGDGTFGVPIEITHAIASNFFVADFNEDGNVDIIMASGTSTLILFGHGDGTFGSPVSVALSPIVGALADLNHDGHMDLISFSQLGTSLSVSLGYGDGTFQQPLVTPMPPGCCEIAIADFNQDGILDVALTDVNTGLIVMFGNGDGTFGAGQKIYAGDSPAAIAVGDFDGDGYPDLAVANAEYVVQLFNDGTGAFPANLGYSYGFSGLVTVAVADVNGDGYPDLLCGSYPSSQLYAFLNLGYGLLDYPYIFGGVPSQSWPLVTDFNGDGVPDLLLSGLSTAAVVLGSQSVLQLYSGDNQASLGGALFNPIEVYAPVGEPVTFETPASGPSATFFGTSPTTYSTVADTTGVASSGQLSSNGIGGPFTAVAFPTGDNLPEDAITFHLSNGCSESLSSTALAAPASGAAIAVAIYGAPPCGWTAVSNTAGVTVSPQSGSGPGTVIAVLPPNSGTSDITGSVTIAGQTLPVTIDFTSQTFSDVLPGAYDFDAVNLLAGKGITTGCAADEFCPNANVARDQMAVFLVRTVFGTNTFTYSPTPYFQDVPSTYWAFAYIQKLYELGITSGCGASLYCPADPVTRAQMAVFIIRARYGTETTITTNPTPYFADVPTGAFAFADIQRMYQDGVTTGCTATPLDYCPGNPVTRGEMAIFLMRGGFNELLPPTAPLITSISPAAISLGATASFTITGTNTTFQQGLTTLVFPANAGITVNSITVTSATSMQVSLTAASNSPVQPVSIYEQSEPQEAVLPNGLLVQ